MDQPHTASHAFDEDALDRFRRADRHFTAYNVRRALREAEGAFEERDFGGGVIGLRDLTREDAYYNRLVGLTGQGIGALAAGIDWYHAEGRDCHVTLMPDEVTPEVLQALGDRGFRAVSQDWVFARHTDGIGPPRSDIAVRRASAGDLDTVFDLWETPDDPIPASVRLLRREAHLVPQFAIYLAEVGGAPVAMATSFLSDGVAWLGNANTRERDRRRGCQQALIQHRIWDARQAGCVWAVTDTEFGTTTHRNAERAGMALAFSRLDLCLPAR